MTDEQGKTATAPSSHVKKYSVSIPEDIAEQVRARVGKGGFSAFVTAAVRRELDHERLAELVQESESRLGPPPETSLAKADKAFDEAERLYEEWLAEQSGQPEHREAC